MIPLSPMGFHYRFTPSAPANQRLTRKKPDDKTWCVGQPLFDIQSMSPGELRFVAGVIDAALDEYASRPSIA